MNIYWFSFIKKINFDIHSRFILFFYFIAVTLVCSSYACEDDIQKSDSANLQINTDAINFTKPALNSAQSIEDIEIRHISGGVARIASVSLREKDVIKELTIIDQDDWQNTQLQDQETRILQILWTPRDEKPDRATLNLVTNVGDFEIELNTPDLDAEFILNSTRGLLNANQNVIEINGVAAGSTEAIPIYVNSIGLAPLILDKICILDTDGRCKELDRAQRNSLLLCQSLQANACIPLEMPDPLLIGSSYTFAIRYQAANRGVDTESITLLIESNSSAQSRLILNVRATPCVLGVNADQCGLCGNGMIDEEEECDDGNQNNNDACKSDCLFNICGDRIIYEEMEACDDGNNDDSDACLSNCQLAMCGDGVVSLSEVCDDGNENDQDECLSTCQVARCGDGVVSLDEDCDDGNQEEDDACLNNCTFSTCGDAVVQSHEECDDGNEDNTDQCLTTCRFARCGDGVVSLDEACDDGNNDPSDLCLPTCEEARCGDGITNAMEACDDGNMSNNDACTRTCETARCGDGYIWQGHEVCDTGAIVEMCRYGTLECEVCDLSCRITSIQGGFCGDGIVQMEEEECDDGNAVSESCPYGEGSCTICNEICLSVEGMATFCGDGIINGNEACDGQEGCDTDCTILPNADPCTPFCPMLDWIAVSAAQYTMGSNLNSAQESPAHSASVNAFEMTRTEVTAAEYKTCVEAGVCETPRDRNDNPQCTWGVQNRLQHPINCITWHQARTFAQWVGGDLPSEAQWERVARGTNANHTYPWGEADPSCERAVISEDMPGCGRNSTWTVCSLEAGLHPDGFCDLIGNVWEWTLDIYQPYTMSAQSDEPRCTLPECTSTNVTRTLRGGGWTIYAAGWRASMRDGYGDQSALNFFGFRCVR